MKAMQAAIYEQGWAPVEFNLSHSSREEYAHLGRNLILLSTEDQEIADALRFELVPGLNVGNNNPTLYGVSGALNSNDDKLWLHAGFQSEKRAAEALPRLSKTPEAKAYFAAHNEVLHLASKSLVTSLRMLSDNPKSIRGLFLPRAIDERVMHLRVVRYLNLDKALPNDEVIAGHGDMDLASLGIFETHTGYLKGVPMDYEWIRWDNDIDRQQYIRELYGRMQPIAYDLNTKAAFFFGCGVAGLNHQATDSGLDKKFPSMYHAGFLPDEDQPTGNYEWMFPHERISIFAFLHPRVSVLRNPLLHHIPTVETCRPLLTESSK